MIQMTEQEFQTIQTYIRRKYGVNLSKKKYLIESKLWIELARHHVSTYGEYWQKLRMDASGGMEQRMMDLLTTNYSYFLREKKHFDFINETVLPELKQPSGMVFRVLCAGCASGQEAYTTAMCLMDARQTGRLRVPFEITALDVSEEELHRARKAVYGSGEYARLPLPWRERYCDGFHGGEFTVADSVKEKVHFCHHNLMEPLIHCRELFHLVLCRNVLIYIYEPERTQMLKHVAETLRPGGYLLVGHTESLMQSVDGLHYVQPAVYRKGENNSCREKRHGS